MKKTPVPFADFECEQGIKGDAHFGKDIRQVSLLGLESIEKMRQKGLNAVPGDFGENVTLAGIEIHTLPLGTKIRLGSTVLLELTQIGKECVERCAIYDQIGDCVMPREGVFARVLTGGRVRAGDDAFVIPGG
ncbi:MAG: MOSC domain-containing protein [Candidatus Eisenbacteria bacterium]|nr:MOSC domain-containing protein [Candidatus Eisenbacteria bacterium]